MFSYPLSFGKRKPPPGLVKREDNLFTRTRRRVISLWHVLNPANVRMLSLLMIFIANLALFNTPLLVRIENIFLDYLFRLRPPVPVDSSIVFVEIAEDSLQAFGRWPWSRAHHAVLTHILNEWGAKAIVFDFLFKEPSPPQDDGAFEEAVSKTSGVYFPVVLETRKEGKNWLHGLPALEKNARALGHINAVPDPDGIIRRVEPYLKYGGEIYPHLALKVAMDARGGRTDLESLHLPLDSEGNFLVNWAGPWKETFTHYSYLDVLRSFDAERTGEKPILNPGMLRGKICLIGVTATGLADIKANPLENIYPAVGVNASIINSVLTQRYLYPATHGANRLCLAAMGLITILLLISLRPWISFAGCFALAAAGMITSYVLFSRWGIWIYTAHPLVLIFTLFSASTLSAQVIAERERRRLFDLAAKDGLTGLFGIRHFRMVLNEIVLEAQRLRQPLSLILMDVDNFKQINDTCGHPVGDEVLKKIAGVIQAALRRQRAAKQMDLIARYGGEEFIVLLKNATITDAAFKIAERIRRAVEQMPIEWDGKSLNVTVSAGISTLRIGERLPDDFVQRADAALYRAKKEGKNRVCLER